MIKNVTVLPFFRQNENKGGCQYTYNITLVTKKGLLSPTNILCAPVSKKNGNKIKKNAQNRWGSKRLVCYYFVTECYRFIFLNPFTVLETELIVNRFVPHSILKREHTVSLNLFAPKGNVRLFLHHSSYSCNTRVPGISSK